MPKRTDIKSILIIGAGPIVIGQACEFDYSGAQACKALRDEGYRVILVNSNPATIMTDPEMADVTYIEPITWRMVEKIIEKERPDALLPTMGGQTALNCALDLAKNGVLDKYGVEMIGAKKEAIDKAEDREKFKNAMAGIGLESARSALAHSLEEALQVQAMVGFPTIIRPSFTLGGTGGGIAYATPGAAQTFNDDLDEVRAMGIRIVSDDEARRLDADRIELRDLDLAAIRAALAAFEVPGEFDGIAIGCLDHGAAPPGVSDRLFRFEHLRRVVERRNDLLAFATHPADLPPYLTRARAMVASASGEAPVVFMDTGPAAALGALHDERVALHDDTVVLNLGNMHLLGFHLRGRRIASLYEHHTGEVTPGQIVRFTGRMAAGTLEHSEIFNSRGHGALAADRSLVRPALPAMVATTGPQREKIRSTALQPYFAAPYGDMMISGCFGLVRAFAEVYPEAVAAIEHRLGPLPVS